MGPPFIAGKGSNIIGLFFVFESRATTLRFKMIFGCTVYQWHHWFPISGPSLETAIAVMYISVFPFCSFRLHVACLISFFASCLTVPRVCNPTNGNHTLSVENRDAIMIFSSCSCHDLKEGPELSKAHSPAVIGTSIIVICH